MPAEFHKKVNTNSKYSKDQHLTKWRQHFLWNFCSKITMCEKEVIRYDAYFMTWMSIFWTKQTIYQNLSKFYLRDKSQLGVYCVKGNLSYYSYIMISFEICSIQSFWKGGKLLLFLKKEYVVLLSMKPQKYLKSGCQNCWTRKTV